MYDEIYRVSNLFSIIHMPMLWHWSSGDCLIRVIILLIMGYILKHQHTDDDIELEHFYFILQQAVTLFSITTRWDKCCIDSWTILLLIKANVFLSVVVRCSDTDFRYWYMMKSNVFQISFPLCVRPCSGIDPVTTDYYGVYTSNNGEYTVASTYW